jgi:hypothetical protein
MKLNWNSHCFSTNIDASVSIKFNYASNSNTTCMWFQIVNYMPLRTALLSSSIVLSIWLKVLIITLLRCINHHIIYFDLQGCTYVGSAFMQYLVNRSKVIILLVEAIGVWLEIVFSSNGYALLHYFEVIEPTTSTQCSFSIPSN